MFFIILSVSVYIHLSTVPHRKGSKNCTMHLPVLELGPSRSIAQCLHHYTTIKNTVSTKHSSFHYLPLYNNFFNLSQCVFNLGKMRNTTYFIQTRQKRRLLFSYIEARSKLTSNPALLNVRAHDAKLVLSFLTLARYRDLRDLLRSPIVSHVSLQMPFIA